MNWTFDHLFCFTTCKQDLYLSYAYVVCCARCRSTPWIKEIYSRNSGVNYRFTTNSQAVCPACVESSQSKVFSLVMPLWKIIALSQSRAIFGSIGMSHCKHFRKYGEDPTENLGTISAHPDQQRWTSVSKWLGAIERSHLLCIAQHLDGGPWHGIDGHRFHSPQFFAQVGWAFP